MKRADRTTYIIEFTLDEMYKINSLLNLIHPDQDAEDKELMAELRQVFFVR